jgi:signal transduction histidine kinase
MNSDAYRGPDRRRTVPVNRVRLSPAAVVSTVALGALSAWVLTDSIGPFATIATLRPTADTLNSVATLMFFGAGVLCYSRWRRTGEATFAIRGAALLAFAIVTFPLVLISRALFGDLSPYAWNGVIRLVAALIAAVMLFATSWIPAVDSMLNPRRRIAIGVTATTSTFALIEIAYRAWTMSVSQTLNFSIAVQLAAGTVWLGTALAFAIRGLRANSRTILWAVAPATLLGIAGAFRAEASATSSGSWLVGAAYLTVLAGGLSLLNAGVDMHEALAADGSELLSTNIALADAEKLLHEIERRRREVEHDASSMIAALCAASRTLDQFDTSPDSDTRHRLRSAMNVELERLGRLIDAPTKRPLSEFNLADVMLPVIATQQANGLEVEADLPCMRVQGRPDDLAEALQNLLINARVHAPGSLVTVSAQADGKWVRVLVDDRGPGVDAHLWGAVFERSVRGPGTTVGSGLGLPVARRLMREQQGDVEIADRPGGGARFVLSCPSAARAVWESDSFELLRTSN